MNKAIKTADANVGATLSKALFDLNPSGVFKERLETEVTLAPRRAR